MKRRTKYVGLDVHQGMTVASVREEGGRVVARSAVAAGAKAGYCALLTLSANVRETRHTQRIRVGREGREPEDAETTRENGRREWYNLPDSDGG